MTNKPMLSVKRELLERILSHDFAEDCQECGIGQSEAWKELRAILDSQHIVCSNGILCQNSKCAECGGNGAYKPARLGLVECDACPTSSGCVSTCMKAPKPAAQHQGEPVAYSYKARVYATGIGMVWRDKIELEAPDTEAVEVKDLVLLYANPVAQACANENANFDAWREDQIAALIRMGYQDAAKAFRDLGSIQWAGWQGRARLAKQPALVAVDVGLLERFPEINFANYGQDEVEALQAWAFEAYEAIARLNGVKP